MGRNDRIGGSRYLEIAERLCADIRADKYAVSGAFPSLTQIMRRFGVSRATALHSVEELKRKGMIGSRPGAGLYVKNRLRTLGLIIPGIAYSEFFPPIVSGLSRLAQKEGYGLLFGDIFSESPQKRAEQARALAHDFAEKRVSGVIFQPIEFLKDAACINREIAAIFDLAGIPVVLIDYDIMPPPARSGYDLVGINNFDAGRRLAQHLLDVGAKRIHFLMRRYWAASVMNRLEGVKSVLSAAGKIDPVLNAEPNDAKAIETYLKKRRPDAIICGNDTAAARLMITLRKLGRRVPDDIMVAGFDDVQLASFLQPQLTTIHQPCTDIACLAFRALQERIATPDLPPREIALFAPLVVRESTQPPKSRGRLKG